MNFSAEKNKGLEGIDGGSVVTSNIYLIRLD